MVITLGKCLNTSVNAYVCVNPMTLESNVYDLALPLPIMGPHFSTDAIIETSCGLEYHFFSYTKLSAGLIIMPISVQKPELGILGYSNLNIHREISALYALMCSNITRLFIKIVVAILVKPMVVIEQEQRYAELTLGLGNKV